MKNSNSGGQTGVIIMDFSKAFDVVPHNLLFMKLRYLGISVCALDWTKYFLANRRQRVVVDGEFFLLMPQLALMSRKALCSAHYFFCVI